MNDKTEKILVFQDNQYETTEMPLTNINSFWFKGVGYDITIGEDVRGDPRSIIGVNRIGKEMKLLEAPTSWRGKIVKIVGADSRKRSCARQIRISPKTTLRNLTRVR